MPRTLKVCGQCRGRAHAQVRPESYLSPGKAGRYRSVPRSGNVCIREMGARALVVTGRSPERAAPLTGALKAAGVGCASFAVEGEPTLDVARRGVEFAREEKCGLVIGFGGGSAMDAGKAIAALLSNTGDVLDYLEVIGKGRPLLAPSAPFIAVPTTAGTGSEVTRNSVLGSPEHQVKASLRRAGGPPSSRDKSHDAAPRWVRSNDRELTGAW